MSFSFFEKHHALQKQLDIYSFSLNSSSVEAKDLPTKVSDSGTVISNFGLGITFDYRNELHEPGVSPIVNLSVFQNMYNLGNAVMGAGIKWRDVYNTFWIDLNLGAGFLIGPYKTYTYFVDNTHTIIETRSENKNAFSLIPLLSLSIGHPVFGKDISLGITPLTLDISTFIFSISI